MAVLSLDSNFVAQYKQVTKGLLPRLESSAFEVSFILLECLLISSNFSKSLSSKELSFELVCQAFKWIGKEGYRFSNWNRNFFSLMSTLD